MAEILISLTIIGVIAAITLPSLVGNINEKTWATQRKALYSRMSQALSMLPSLNGYGIGITQAETNSKAAMVFVTEGLSSVLKINNICANDKLGDCGIPSKIKTMNNNKMDFPKNLTELNPMFTSVYIHPDTGSSFVNPQKDIDTNAVAFETTNGESIAVFYNPLCQPDMGEFNWHYIQSQMCANFIYDLNGKKGPNKVGKDIGFITALFPTESEIVAPMPLEKNAKDGNSNNMQQTSVAAACRAQDENSRLPNRNELAAMFYNKYLLGLSDISFWSGSVVGAYGWAIRFGIGDIGLKGRSTKYQVRCIKR